MAKYYGDKKIKDVQEKGDRVVMDFGDEQLEISKKLYDVSVSKKRLDDTQLWDRQLEPVVGSILQLLLDWDIKLEQLDYMDNKLKNSIEHNLKRATGKLWGKKVEDRTLSDVDKVLTDDKQQK